jgi:membrane associated rhomboid family serine protease
MNLGMLLAFGTGIEKALGQKKFLVFYFLCGFAGALCHLLLNPTSATPMIGASGAISGLFGGILLMMQSQGLMGEGFKKLMPFVALWILMSLFFGWIGMPGSDSSIAWATHVGGFIAGLLAYKFVQKLRV